MKKLLIAGVIALALAPTLASAADMNGNWAVAGAFDGMGVKFNLACHFTQGAGGKFSGPCKDPQQAAPNAVSGSIAGTAVTFAYDTTYMGVNVHMTYKGVLAANGAIAGGIDANNGTATGSFTAHH